MCGLFGFQLNANPRVTREQLLIWLAIAGTEAEKRGTHAHGMWYQTDNAKQVLYKNVGAFSECFLSRAVKGIPQTLIGHTRYGTTGKNTRDNAHPFEIKGIVGAHNGIVYNHREQNKKYKKRSCSVDSQHIFHAIALGHDLSEIEAYGALTYARTHEPETVYLGTFNNGDLEAMHVPRIGTFWHSTRSGLWQSIKLAFGASLKMTEYQLQDDMLYRITHGELREHDYLPFAVPESSITWQHGSVVKLEPCFYCQKPTDDDMQVCDACSVLEASDWQNVID